MFLHIVWFLNFFQLLKATKLKKHWVYSTSDVCMIIFMVTLLVTLDLIKKIKTDEIFQNLSCCEKGFFNVSTLEIYDEKTVLQNINEINALSFCGPIFPILKLDC